MKQTQVRMPDEAIALIQREAAFLHTTYSDFIRQAAVEKARVMLGEEPKLPLHIATKDKGRA
jgi:uncharacterized protein (DUF1778 family)